MQEIAMQDLKKNYEHELRSIDIFNPYRNNTDYLKTLSSYMNSIDMGLKSDDPEFFRVITNKFNEKTRGPGNLFDKWMFYDISKYYTNVDKSALGINHTRYDPFPASILGNELKQQKSYILVEKVLSSVLISELKNIKSLENQLRSNTVLVEDKLFTNNYEKSKKSLIRLISDIAFAQIKQIKFNQALVSIQEKLTLDPKDVIAYGLKAQALIGRKLQGDIDDALKILKNLDENREDVLWLKSKCFAILGEMGQAKSLLVSLLFKSYSNGFIKRNYAEAFLSIVSKEGYSMDANENIIIGQLENYFGKNSLIEMLEKKETYNWNTPIEQSRNDLILSRAFYNSVWEGNNPNTVSGKERSLTGAPVYIKGETTQLLEPKTFTVEVKKPRKIIKK